MALNTIPNPGLTKRGFPTVRVEQPLMINGDMQVNQRGTVTGVATNTYVIDQWITEGDDCTLTISKDTDVPTGEGFASSQKLDVTSANASVSAGDVQVISQRFEGQNIQMFKKGTATAEKFTVAFWVKSTTTGTFILHLQDDDNSRHCAIAYTISSASTWEKKVLTLPADTTGAFGNDANRSLRVQWYLDAGSDYTSGTLATTWASNTTANRAVGQTTGWTTSTSSNFWITGVQLLVGEFNSTTIPSFDFESYGDSLARCQRYFQLPKNWWAHSDGSTATAWKCYHDFPVIMRAAPTLTASGTPTVNKMNANAAGPNSISTPGSANVGGFQLSFTTMATGTGSAAATNTPYQAYDGFAASAEL
jgi:hypothetical protein